MKNEAFENFWAEQQSSLNRGSDQDYYARKAREHAFLLSTASVDKGLVDFGCGAGELLACLYPLLKAPIIAMDFSAPLLEKAKANNKGHHITFELGNALDYTPASGAVWMSCGAVGQFSTESELEQFVRKFKDNNDAEALYFFDCVDPIKFHLFRAGVIGKYQVSQDDTHRLKRIYRLFKYARWHLKWSQTSRLWCSLGSVGMGYGYHTSFWHRIHAQFKRLTLEIISSMQFEYRYHVILRKK